LGDSFIVGLDTRDAEEVVCNILQVAGTGWLASTSRDWKPPSVSEADWIETCIRQGGVASVALGLADVVLPVGDRFAILPEPSFAVDATAYTTVMPSEVTRRLRDPNVTANLHRYQRK
jgi:hypothetical protein